MKLTEPTSLLVQTSSFLTLMLFPFFLAEGAAVSNNQPSKMWQRTTSLEPSSRCSLLSSSRCLSRPVHDPLVSFWASSFLLNVFVTFVDDIIILRLFPLSCKQRRARRRRRCLFSLLLSSIDDASLFVSCCKRKKTIANLTTSNSIAVSTTLRFWILKKIKQQVSAFVATYIVDSIFVISPFFPFVSWQMLLSNSISTVWYLAK